MAMRCARIGKLCRLCVGAGVAGHLVLDSAHDDGASRTETRLALTWLGRCRR